MSLKEAVTVHQIFTCQSISKMLWKKEDEIDAKL